LDILISIKLFCQLIVTRSKTAAEHFIWLFAWMLLLCLSQMLYALCLSYHSNTEAVLFVCILSG